MDKARPTTEDFAAVMRVLGDLVESGSATAFEPQDRYNSLHSAMMEIVGLLGVGGPALQEIERSENARKLRARVEGYSTSNEAPLPVVAVLRDILDNGIIYWEPNTSRGHVAKALMVARAERALAAGGEVPLPSRRLRRYSEVASQGPWFISAVEGALVGGCPGGVNPEERRITDREVPSPDIYADCTLRVQFADGVSKPLDSDLAAESVNYVRELLAVLGTSREVDTPAQEA